jgi:hypothetical protein
LNTALTPAPGAGPTKDDAQPLRRPPSLTTPSPRPAIKAHRKKKWASAHLDATTDRHYRLPICASTRSPRTAHRFTLNRCASTTRFTLDAAHSQSTRALQPPRNANRQANLSESVFDALESVIAQREDYSPAPRALQHRLRFNRLA